MEVMMEVDGVINTNNDIEPMEVYNIVINNNNEIQPMEVENDEAANELSIAIQNQNPFHYAKLYLHKEVTNRDAKINELLAQIDNCHQQMNDMQRKDRLFYMQKELNQQKDAHQKTKDEMQAKNQQYQNLIGQFIQKSQQYQQLEVTLRQNERLVEEAALKSRQCDEMWQQLRQQTETAASNALKTWVKRPNIKPQLKRRAEDNIWESDSPCFKRRRPNAQEGTLICSY